MAYTITCGPEGATTGVVDIAQAAKVIRALLAEGVEDIAVTSDGAPIDYRLILAASPENGRLLRKG